MKRKNVSKIILLIMITIPFIGITKQTINKNQYVEYNMTSNNSYPSDYDGIDETKIDFTTGWPFYTWTSPFAWKKPPQIAYGENSTGIGINGDLEKQERATTFYSHMQGLIIDKSPVYPSQEFVFDNFNYAFFISSDDSLNFELNEIKYQSWEDGDFNDINVSMISQEEAIDYFINHNISKEENRYIGKKSELLIGIIPEADSDFTGYKMTNSLTGMGLILNYQSLFENPKLMGKFEKYFLNLESVTPGSEISDGRYLANKIMYEWINLFDSHFRNIFNEFYFTPTNTEWTYPNFGEIKIYDFWGNDITYSTKIPEEPFTMYWYPGDYSYIFTPSNETIKFTFRVNNDYYTDDGFKVDINISTITDPNADVDDELYWWAKMLIVFLILIPIALLTLLILKFTKNKKE